MPCAKLLGTFGESAHLCYHAGFPRVRWFLPEVEVGMAVYGVISAAKIRKDLPHGSRCLRPLPLWQWQEIEILLPESR